MKGQQSWRGCRDRKETHASVKSDELAGGILQPMHMRGASSEFSRITGSKTPVLLAAFQFWPAECFCFPSSSDPVLFLAPFFLLPCTLIAATSPARYPGPTSPSDLLGFTVPNRHPHQNAPRSNTSPNRPRNYLSQSLYGEGVRLFFLQMHAYYPHQRTFQLSVGYARGPSEVIIHATSRIIAPWRGK
jgi:hypothetical protein